jgi:threonyl-tRNA synthetase
VSEAHASYAQTVANELRAAGFRVLLDTNNESMGKKIRQAKQQKLPYFIVIGDKEVESVSVTIESRDTGISEVLIVKEVIAKLTAEQNV